MSLYFLRISSHDILQRSPSSPMTWIINLTRSFIIYSPLSHKSCYCFKTWFMCDINVLHATKCLVFVKLIDFQAILFYITTFTSDYGTIGFFKYCPQAAYTGLSCYCSSDCVHYKSVKRIYILIIIYDCQNVSALTVFAFVKVVVYIVQYILIGFIFRFYRSVFNLLLELLYSAL